MSSYSSSFGLTICPVEEINNLYFKGEYLLIDTRSSVDYSASRVVESLSIPPPISITDYCRVPSLLWVGLYCVSEETNSSLFSSNSYRNKKIIIGVSSVQKDIIDNNCNPSISWAYRLFELFQKAMQDIHGNSNGNSNGGIRNNDSTGNISDISSAVNGSSSSNNNQNTTGVRMCDLTELFKLAPVIFTSHPTGGASNNIVDRWSKPPTIVLANFLYLSSMSEAVNPKICGPSGYLNPSHIINASNKDSSNAFESVGHTKYLCISLNDSEESDMSQYFVETFAFIEAARRTPGGRCLIHCQMGISRSTTIIIYYLMRANNLTLKEAYDHVKSRRPEIFPNKSFMQQLRRAELSLRPELVESTIKEDELGELS